MILDELTSIVIGECINIHNALGPGLFESVYEEALCYRLKKRNLIVEQQKGIPVFFEEIKLDIGFRADLIIENKLLIEIKSVEIVPKVAFKQVLTYLSFSEIKTGLLINFNVEKLKDGIKRVFNNRLDLEHSSLNPLSFPL